MPTRCCCPPESSRGCASSAVGRGRRARSAVCTRFCALRSRQRRQQQRQLDVALGRQHRQQVVELEHEADVIARASCASCAVAELVDALAGDLDACRRSARSRPPIRFSSVSCRSPTDPSARGTRPVGMSRSSSCSTAHASRCRACNPCDIRRSHQSLHRFTRPVTGRRRSATSTSAALARAFALRSGLSTGAATTRRPVDARQDFDLPVALAAGGTARALDAPSCTTQDDTRVAVTDDARRPASARRDARRRGRRGLGGRLRGSPPSRPCPAGCADRACRSRCARAPSPSAGPPSARC